MWCLVYLFEFWNVASLLLVHSQVLVHCTQPLSPTKLPTCDEEEEELREKGGGGEKEEGQEQEQKKRTTPQEILSVFSCQGGSNTPPFLL